jgi:hypothetical protein
VISLPHTAAATMGKYDVTAEMRMERNADSRNRYINPVLQDASLRHIVLDLEFGVSHEGLLPLRTDMLARNDKCHPCIARQGELPPRRVRTAAVICMPRIPMPFQFLSSRSGGRRSVTARWHMEKGTSLESWHSHIYPAVSVSRLNSFCLSCICFCCS